MKRLRSYRTVASTFPLGLTALVGLLLLVLLAIGLSGQIARSARTAEAKAEIVAVDLQMGTLGIPRGWYVRYTFSVYGSTHGGMAFRAWNLESIRQAKVCFNPADPENQVLVFANSTCQ